MKTRLKRVVKRLLLPADYAPRAVVPKKRYEWSIGIYGGGSPFHLESPAEINNPVLTHKNVLDVPAIGVADPFMLRTNHSWYMFFEVVNHQTRRGEIGLAQSANGANWNYQQIVLAEPFHLSYPYVFCWMDDYYMIPETFQTKTIRLYKASQFPIRWSFIATLLSAHPFSDSSIFRYDDKWWIFTETNPDRKCDTLRLYYSYGLQGPWHEHPKSPIIQENPHIARPAGRVLVLDNKVFRYAQDCYPTYGTHVRAFEISELTTSGYHEREVCENPILAASGAGWNGSGMHHVDPHIQDDGQWIACVDGRSAMEIPT